MTERDRHGLSQQERDALSEGRLATIEELAAALRVAHTGLVAAWVLLCKPPQAERDAKLLDIVEGSIERVKAALALPHT